MAGYTIDSKQELLEFNTLTGKFAAVAYAGNVFTLTTDVDLAGESWTPIVDFNGYFDGANFTVSNLTINNPASDYQGFFANIDMNAPTYRFYPAVKNLGLVDVSVVGQANVGGLVGRTIGMTSTKPVTDCYVTGNVAGKEYVGGLVGLSNTSYWQNCHVNVDVVGGRAGDNAQGIGGFCGAISGVNVVLNCYSIGVVSYIGTGDQSKVGGFIGEGSSTETFCYWNTQTSGQATSQGSEIGLTTAQMKIRSSFTNWDFENSWWVAIPGDYPELRSFVPANYTIDSVQDLLDFASLTGKFAGILWKDNIFKLTTDLDIVGVDPLGDGNGWWPVGRSGQWFNGFFDGDGHVISNLTIDRSASSRMAFFGYIDAVSGGGADTCTDAAVSDTGGKVTITQAGRFNDSLPGQRILVSWNSVFYVDGWYNIVSVDGSENYIVIDLAYVANIANGVTGSVGTDSALTDNPIKNLGLEDVSIVGDSVVGGLVGSNLGIGMVSGFPIMNCYVTGTIAGTNNVGGIVAQVNNCYLLNCYADVDITVTSVGGRCSMGSLVGSDTIGLDCVNCYGKGVLTHVGVSADRTFIGGLTGELDYDIVATPANCAATQGAGGKVLLTQTNAFLPATTSMYASVEFNDVTYANNWFTILDVPNVNSILIDLDWTADVANGIEVDVYDPSTTPYATDCFWDTETTGVAVDGNGDGDAVGKTTVQMKQEATFTNWDFINDWWITEDSTYPALRVFGDPAIVKPTSVSISGVTTLTEGDILLLTAVPVGGSGGYTYQWSKGGASISGATSVVYTKTSVIGDAGDYTCTVTNGGGSTISSVATVTVGSSAVKPTSVSISGVIAVDVGGTLLLTAVPVGGSGSYTYQWSKGGVLIVGAISVAYTKVVVVGDVGDYTCTVTNGGGSTISSVATVTVGVDPVPLVDRHNRGNLLNTWESKPSPTPLEDRHDDGNLLNWN